jgi:hypothetical protein
MKKIFITVSLVSLFTAGAYAQGLSGGLKVGANFSNQKLSAQGESESLDSKVGFQVGGYLTSMISDKFGIQPELLYSGMGAKESDVNFNLSYLSVPVMLRYNVAENVNLQAGPQVGFLLSAKAKYEGESEDMKEMFNSIDFGAAFGLGLDFGKINASARYYLGIANIAADEFIEDSEIDDLKWKNSAFQLSVVYKLFGE